MLLNSNRRQLCQWGSLVLLLVAYPTNLVAVDSPFPSVEILGKPYRLLQTRYTLGGLIETVTDRNALLGLFCVIFFIIVPIARSTRHLLPESKWQLQMALRVICHWDLLPLLAGSLVLLRFLGPDEAPSISMGTGFYLLVLREAFIIGASRTQANNPEAANYALVHRAIPVVLSAAAFVTLIAGLFGPAFHVDTMGLIRKGPENIAGGIMMLFSQGKWPLGGMILLFSVLFPSSKIVALVLLLRSRNKASGKYVGLLEILGPLSLLDAVILVVLLISYLSIPVINASVNPDWGYWCFVCSVFLNSSAVTLASFSESPTHRP